MKTGLVIYACSISRLAEFYSHVFAFNVTESENKYALLDSCEFELVLLETEISKKSGVDYKPRTSTPLKPTFFVDCTLETISKKILAKGGNLYPPKDWKFGGRLVCDANDCEGNIFQLRIRKSAT